MAPEGAFAGRFYLVAEVLSESNTDRDIELKRVRYIRHPENLYCLIVDQTKIYAELWARASGWERVALDGAGAMLILPEFDFTLRLGDLYRGTPLWVPGGAA